MRLALLRSWPTAILLMTGVAQADPPGPVTACAADTQSGAGLNLAQALAAGGVIRFQCAPGSTIVVTRRYVLRESTLIDGGDAVTLDGRGLFGPMLSTGENIILRRLKARGFAKRPIVAGGVPIGRIVGSVLAASGDAELDHVTIENNDFPISVRGTATVRDSVFLGNRGGLILSVEGTAFIDRSRFTGNTGTVAISAGWVRSCSFNGPTGGVLSVHRANGPVEIRHSTFLGGRGGSPVELSQRSGRGGPHTITVRANVFRDNDGGAGAGAIAIVDDLQQAIDSGASQSVRAAIAAMPPARFALSYNRFTGNRGVNSGAIAAHLGPSDALVSTGDIFAGNVSAGDGGAIAVSTGGVRISHALFKANRAGGRGAALAVAAAGFATVSNTLVVGNAGPLGAISGDSVTLANVSIADNDSAGLLIGTRGARAGNVLLARNRPSDCLRVPASAFRSGHGLQSDGSCPGLPVGEAFLDSFYVPAAGSPALVAGDLGLCRGTLVGGVDLAFQSRADPAACALGAFERPPVQKFTSKTDHRGVHADVRDEFSDDDGYRTPDGTRVSPTGTGTTDRTRTGGPAVATVMADPPSEAAAMDRVLAAVAAEEASPSERVRVFIVRGDLADDYYLDRIRPGRFHMIMNPKQGGLELIVVDGMQWARAGVASPWRKSPARDTTGGLPSMADVFRKGLNSPVEAAGPDGGRSVEGVLEWTNGVHCKGKVLLRINAEGLPVLFRFDGLCDGKPFRFRQAFSFAGPVTIEPPE